MIPEERPGIDGEGALRCHPGEAGDEVRPVRIVAGDGRPLEPPHHDVVEGVGRVQAGLARHRLSRLGQSDKNWNVPHYMSHNPVHLGRLPGEIPPRPPLVKGGWGDLLER